MAKSEEVMKAGELYFEVHDLRQTLPIKPLPTSNIDSHTTHIAC